MELNQKTGKNWIALENSIELNLKLELKIGFLDFVLVIWSM